MGYKHNIEDIVEKGAGLIRKNGYYNTGITEILEASNLPKGSFYNFFKSKEDFALRAIKHYGKDMRKKLQEGMKATSELSPLERLKHVYQALESVSVEERYQSGCLLNNISIEAAAEDESLVSIANEEFISLIEILAETIEEGQQKGEIRSDVSALELAEFLHLTYYGVLSRSKATKSTKAFQLLDNMGFNFLRS
ncbi:MAG: TetR/AcrR family transcriptional regulator [Cyclobacteriaceae bacterium]|nr:TetR/AcrR family transcriptional regulator [Cyclobacteriaceae bacterium]